jgi:hypothetical protein
LMEKTNIALTLIKFSVFPVPKMIRLILFKNKVITY